MGIRHPNLSGHTKEWGPYGLMHAVNRNLLCMLEGKVQTLGLYLRGLGYLDLEGLQELRKMPSNMVAHIMCWAAFTLAAHPARGGRAVGSLTPVLPSDCEGHAS